MRPGCGWRRCLTIIALGLVAVSKGGRADPQSDLQKGEYLARAANCAACHTMPDGKTLAGGLPMKTPLGVIYTTNITPDPVNGIGQYSLEDFGRALRQGVAKDGHHLYPAMPYPSYAKLTDADVALLFGYFQNSVTAVSQPNRPSDIKWPLNMRWPLRFWNLVYNRATPYRAPADRDSAWNRGAYLVQGPGHCGACHTPRGLAFQEKALDESGALFLSGAPLDNWSSPNLRGDDRTGLGRWSGEDLTAFLKVGHNRFGSSFGTMNEVVNSSTQYLNDADLAAIALYLKSIPTAKKNDSKYSYTEVALLPPAGADPKSSPAELYLQKCGSCHGNDGKGQSLYVAPIAGNPILMDPDATSVINIILNGSIPLVVAGIPDLYKMPQFRRMLNDQEIADLTSFIRAGWGNDTEAVTAKDVAAIRSATEFVRYKSQVLTMQ